MRSPSPKAGVRRARDDQNRWFIALAVPFHRLCEQVTVVVGPRDQQNADGRQAIRVAIGLFALLQMTFAFQLFEQAFQINARSTFDPERFGNVAFGGERWIGGDPVKDLGLCGDACHATSAITALSRRHG